MGDEFKALMLLRGLVRGDMLIELLNDPLGELDGELDEYKPDDLGEEPDNLRTESSKDDEALDEGDRCCGCCFR